MTSYRIVEVATRVFLVSSARL